MPNSARIIITRITAPDEIGRQLEQPMSNMAANVAVRMRRLVPKATFRLRDSIEAQKATRNGAEVTSTVTFGGKMVRGKMVNYHLLVERGTSKMRAQPYARPALAQSKSLDLTVRIAS